MSVQDSDLPVSKPGEFQQFLANRNEAKPAPAATAVEPTHLLDATAATIPAPVAEPTAPESWEDPETHDQIEKPTRADKRIKRLWADREAEKVARLKAEERAQALEAQLAERHAAPTSASPDAADDIVPAAPEALTAAAQARIRPKPDRTAIGTTYATYEDYVEDCAIWGGELAAEKRAVLAEASQAQQAAQTTQTAFVADCAAAKTELADFDQVTTRDLPINQAIWDATVHAPAGLKGHVLYWLGSHPDEVARIAALPPGPALVEMGQIIATVKTERAGHPVATPAPPLKPQSAAPPPPSPVTRTSPQPGRLDTITDPMEFIRVRNEQERSRRRL